MPCQFAGTLKSSEAEASVGHGYDSGLRPRAGCRGGSAYSCTPSNASITVATAAADSVSWPPYSSASVVQPSSAASAFGVSRSSAMHSAAPQRSHPPHPVPRTATSRCASDAAGHWPRRAPRQSSSGLCGSARRSDRGGSPRDRRRRPEAAHQRPDIAAALAHLVPVQPIMPACTC